MAAFICLNQVAYNARYDLFVIINIIHVAHHMIGFHFNSENFVRVALDDAFAAYISNHFEYRLPVGGVQDYGVAYSSMEKRNDNALVNLLRESKCFDYVIDVGGLEEGLIG